MTSVISSESKKNRQQLPARARANMKKKIEVKISVATCPILDILM